MTKRVAIIGTGVSGLTSIKNALEAGLEPTAFERSSWIGGIWYYTEDEHRLVAPKSTIFNTIKQVSSFSDFPVPEEYPNYMTGRHFLNFLQSYAKEFDLIRRIRFNCEVIQVEKSEDYGDTGKWVIHSIKADSGDVCVEIYDYVMVCSGVLSKPFIPKIPGIENYKGIKMHSKEYKTFKSFEGKRILVVGFGNTAADIACELSRHANQVYMSVREGGFIQPRLSGNEIPFRFTSDSRAMLLLPTSLKNLITIWKLQSLFDLHELGLQPQYTTYIPAITNDDLPSRIISGTVIMKDEIIGFNETTVFFKDNSELSDIDVVIFGTGYDVHIPFISNSIFNPDTAHSDLYKNVFLVDHPTIAFIGFFMVLASFCPVLDMQARWAVQVFEGTCTLPSKYLMKKDILKRQSRTLRKERHGANSYSYLLAENQVEYMDDLGSLIGVKPNLFKLLFQDPNLAMKCFFGPPVPAQYRLMGPGACRSRAKQVIDRVEKSRLTPLLTRNVKNTPSQCSPTMWIALSALILLSISILYKL